MSNNDPTASLLFPLGLLRGSLPVWWRSRPHQNHYFSGRGLRRRGHQGQAQEEEEQEAGEESDLPPGQKIDIDENHYDDEWNKPTMIHMIQKNDCVRFTFRELPTLSTICPGPGCLALLSSCLSQPHLVTLGQA